MTQKSAYFNDILRQTLHEKTDFSLLNDILKQTLHEKADFSLPREKSLCLFESGRDFVKTIDSLQKAVSWYYNKDESRPSMFGTRAGNKISKMTCRGSRTLRGAFHLYTSVVIYVCIYYI